jgi:hypothetical protein
VEFFGFVQFSVQPIVIFFLTNSMCIAWLGLISSQAGLLTATLPLERMVSTKGLRATSA